MATVHELLVNERYSVAVGKPIAKDIIVIVVWVVEYWPVAVDGNAMWFMYRNVDAMVSMNFVASAWKSVQALLMLVARYGLILI